MPELKWTLFVLLLLLIGPVAAAEPGDLISVWTSKTWVVADNADTATITAHVINVTPAVHDVAGAIVTIIVDDPVYGRVTPTFATTDALGIATATFKSFNKSGNATIRASYGAIENTTVQRIDHDTPYTIVVDHEDEVNVNETTRIKAVLTDRWGNLIDNKNIAETVHMEVSPPSGGGSAPGFYYFGSYPPSIDLKVNETGQVDTISRISTGPGKNSYWIQGLGSIPNYNFYIQGITTGVPFSMSATISPEMIPPPSYVPADTVSAFSIRYIIYDQFGNPAGNRSVFVSTSLGEEWILWSTPSQGICEFIYGPKDTTTSTTLTAYAMDNATVTKSLDVAFVNTAPTDIIISANPYTMPSHDASTSFTSDISATVMDTMGNPVPGETVTFALGAVTYDESYNVTSDPTLLSTSAVTDADGMATVQFQPGGFDIHELLPDYDPTATGHAVLSATWNGTTRNTQVTWKNWPYLSVETILSDTTPLVGDNFEVTLRLTGDGWALQPDPIDVGLVFDRSGSMAGTKLTDAKTAARSFVDQMNQTRDRIGLVSYSTTPTLSYTLSNNFAGVKAAINGLTASGNTATRVALNMSVDNVYANRNPDPDAVHAVILMTDGDYNVYADPLARGTGITTNTGVDGDTSRHYYIPGHGGVTGVSGANILTEQNISRYALNKEIRIYSISFGSGVGAGVKATMGILSNATHGKYYHAPTGSDLKDVYTLIAGELVTTAGADTTIVSPFTNRTVNNLSYSGGDVFDYIYIANVSTRITWPNGTTTYMDQTTQWYNGTPKYTLSFDIGEIKLGDVWEGTFDLKPKIVGNTSVFGDDSQICFDGPAGYSCDKVPPGHISIEPKTNMSTFEPGDLAVWNLHTTKTGTIMDFLPLEWNLAYSGLYQVTEVLSFKKIDGEWTQFDTKFVSTNGTSTEYSNLDVQANHLDAGYYLIKVEATDEIGRRANATIDAPFQIGSKGKAFIKLE